MDEQKGPVARKKKIVGVSAPVEKKGEGLGIGPVNNTGNYADRREQQQSAAQNRPSQPVQNPFGQAQQQPSQGNTINQVQHRPSQGNTINHVQQRPSQGNTINQAQQRPSQGNTINQAQQRPSQGNTINQTQQRPSQGNTINQAQQRPSQGNMINQLQHRPSQGNTIGQAQQRPPQGNTIGQAQQRPSQGNTIGQAQQRPSQSSAGSSSNHTAQNHAASNRNRQSGSAQKQETQTQQSVQGRSAFGGKTILVIIAILAILYFGRNLLFGGGSTSLPAFTGTGQSSVYDFLGMLSGSAGSSSGSEQQFFTSSMDNNTPEADQTVSAGAREKFTEIVGSGRDTVTILVYMCGTDLESKSGMGTADLKEMVNATLGDHVNLIVYTGGCKSWQNNVVQDGVNQIYQIKNKSLVRLVENDGNASMADPSTLSGFIRYGAKNFPANRMCLIFWDHGGGSISGFGYDERYGRSQSMSLAGINQALRDGGIKFDFIGFDACLMATVENGLMLSQYADYMIASEETEPGVGWYYTNWLTKLSGNTSMPTIQVGKIIADDFVDVCNQKCRGQATTLSVVDLAELAATVPSELTSFGSSTNEMIQNRQFRQVSSARSKTREFAMQSGIDQIDLVHFARNLGTEEGDALARALQGAVKYNRTGGGISNAYGLSIYFPYKKTGKVSQMVSTYKAIGMDDAYTRCIQEFASLEVSGQLSAGTSVQGYGTQVAAPQGLLDSLLGNSSGYYGTVSGNYSASGLESLLGGYFGTSSSGGTGSILDLLIGRSMTAEKAASYILENHFDPSALIWKDGRITLDSDQLDFVESVMMNVFYDDGTGFIDLGFDPSCGFEGNSLVYDFDGSWLTINLHPIAYYRISAVEYNGQFVEIGYTPAYVNGIRANLILVFKENYEEGYIAGAQPVYPAGETDTVAKTMIRISSTDKIQLLCEFYDYEGNYQDTYYFGNEFTTGDQVVIGYAYLPDKSKCRVTYRITDFYQQSYWTPAIN